MKNEDKQCQNCKEKFTIEPEDFQFYEKIQVPPPTFCPDCRFQRRLVFRNERSLYKRKCDLCSKDMITVYSPDKPYQVYCGSCWWSDKWDGLEFGQDYDPSRSFFEQFRELQLKVPYMNLVVDNPTLVNSAYANHAGSLKNCYLVFDADNCENVHYARRLLSDKDSMDSNVLSSSELCYWDINCGKCSRVFFSEDCTNCHDVYFSKNLVGCSNCFGCVNLRNKSYHIFNKHYSKEDYKKKIKEFDLGSFSVIQNLREKAIKFWNQAPHKFMHGQHNVNVSGDYIYESKNAHFMYQVMNIEDSKFCQFISMKPVKDAYDYTEWGDNAQRIYECITVGQYVDNIRFSYACWRANCQNIEYSMYALSSSDIFGCVNIRKKQHCILNKQYSKESFDKLRTRIIEDMNLRPYIDTKGRIFKYGEFFPHELSLYDYNETTAQDYFPLEKKEVLDNGWRWLDKKDTQYQITKQAKELPDNIKDVDDVILKEIIECATCQKAYRIIQQELELLQHFNFPLPRNCFECRNRERQNRLNPINFYDRTCAKCGKEILTTFAPNRPEIVYCESCYNAEVV